MTTLANVRDAWQDNIFDHVNIQAITTCVLDYAIDPKSQSELSRIHYNQEINYISYQVTSATTHKVCNGKETKFSVNITICRATDTLGVNFKRVTDAAETLLSLIETELGTNWNGVVDYSEMPEDAPIVEYSNVADKPCYKIDLKFTGYKFS